MLEIEHYEQSNTADEFIYYCTIIANAFAEALDQNECNLKVAIDLSEDLKETIRDAEDIDTIITRPVTPPPIVTKPTPGDPPTIVKPLVPVEKLIYSPSYSSYLKQNCLKCDFDLPDIDLGNQLRWSWDKLQTHIEKYYELFENMLDPNFCHALYAFQNTCVPDIIKLIAMILTVYTSVLALRKLGGISLNAFVKGLISGLLGQILGSFNVQIDFSKTGLGCLLGVIEELSTLIPDGQNYSKYLSEEQMETLGIDPKSSHEVRKYTDQIYKQTDGTARNTSQVFKEISKTVQRATTDFNESLENIFNVIDYLQCEVGRSGANFIELADYIKELTNLINLLSAIVAIVAKKQLRDKLCVTTAGRDVYYEPDLSQTVDNVYTPFTDLEVSEVISEYLGKVVEITRDENDDVLYTIYDKSKPPLLPKLNLLTCNLKDFIDSHNIEKLTPIIIEEIEQDRIRNLVEDGEYKGNKGIPPEGVGLDYEVVNNSDFTKRTNNWKTYPIEYSKPSFLDEETSLDNLDFNNGTVNVNKDNALQSLLDFVYNNPLTRQEDKTTKEPSKPEESVDPISNKDKPKLSFSDLGSSIQQTSFDSKCRSIDDILQHIKGL